MDLHSDSHLRERVYALLDHELSDEEEASARSHLDSCPDCAEEHRKLEQTVGIVARLGPARAPQGFAARVMRRMRMQRRSSGLRVRAEHKVPYEGAVIVIVIAAMAALLVTLFTHGH